MVANTASRILLYHIRRAYGNGVVLACSGVGARVDWPSVALCLLDGTHISKIEAMAADGQEANIGVAAGGLDGDAVAQPAGCGCCSCLPSASWLGYCVVSSLAAILAIYYAFDSRDSMYSALVFLSTSKVSLTVSFESLCVESCATDESAPRGFSRQHLVKPISAVLYA